MKLIALDVGTKRIGVAKADSAVRIAIPYSAVEVDGNEFKKIASLARAWDINSFVIGLPRNSKGEETEQSRYTRKFAAELKRQISGAKVCFQDESVTSIEAEKRLKTRKKGYNKGDIDSEAAAIILQDFLEQRTGKPTTRAAAAKRKSVKGNKSHRWVAVVAAVAIFLVVVGAIGFGYYRYNLRPPVDVDIDCDSEIEADACEAMAFKIESGASMGAIATELKDAGLIRDELVFQVYVRLNANGKSLKAGEYSLNKAMSVETIADILLKGGKENVFSFTILPGETLRTIKQKLVDAGYSEEAVEAAFAKDYRGKDYDWIFAGKPEDSSLEGYLYGETYEFYKDDTVETIIETVLTEMARVLKGNDLQAKFEAQGLNLYEGITLASIVQKEANKPEDQAKVAKIFYNRLAGAEGGMLGSDVTTQYAVDLVDPNREHYTDNAMALEIDSPYNTRKHPGLTPGPISNPGLSALQAVGAPDESMNDYVYFLTGDDGMMYYSITYEEHQRNIAEFCKELCSVAL